VRYQRPVRLEEIRAGAEVHSVLHLVWLDFESGLRIAVGYADELAVHHGFSISLRERRVIDPAYGAVDDVGGTPCWAPRVGRRVERANILWDDVYDRLRPSLGIGVTIHADYLRRLDYPQTLALDMGEAGSAFVAVAFESELRVLFSRERAEALGLRA